MKPTGRLANPPAQVQASGRAAPPADLGTIDWLDQAPNGCRWLASWLTANWTAVFRRALASFDASVLFIK